jgi:peptide/nickel transport system substrate-binding protein
MRQIDPGHPYYGEDFKYAAFTFKYVKKVEALDDHTVRISLEKPFAPFLYNLAMDAARIVSPRALERWGKDFWKHPVGTGPFQFVEWAPKARIVLQRNAHYWGEPPHLETLIFKSTIDNRDRLLELKTGAIDAMDGISAETLVELHRNEALRVVTTPGLNVGYLGMNTEKKPFDQLLVRRAINHAINKQNLVKLLYRGMAIPAKNPIPPTLWGYADEVVDYDHDPRKARELLKEAGWENGFETTLWVMPVPRPYMPDPEKIGQIIKNSLAAVGIHATIVSHDWDAYLAKVSNGEHDMCLLGWVGDNGDPDNFLYVLLDEDNAVKPNSENCAFFRNASLHELLIRAQQVADRSERAELYHKAQHIVHEEAPWVPIAHAEQLVAFHKTIHDVAQHPTGVIRFQQVWKE